MQSFEQKDANRATRSMSNHKDLDQEVLRKCIILYPIVLGKNPKLFSATSKEMLEQNDSLRTQVEDLLKEYNTLQKLWNINTTTKCTIDSKTRDKKRSNVKENPKIRCEPCATKRIYRDPNTCPGPCYNCHGPHHEYLCPWTCNRCKVSRQLHIPSTCAKRNWKDIMGPFYNEKPLFKEFTPSLECESSESAPSKGQSCSTSKFRDSVAPKPRENRGRFTKRKPERSTCEQHGHSTTSTGPNILSGSGTSDSKVSVSISTTTTHDRYKPKGMSANEAITANSLRQSRKKIPILKGLGISAQNSDETSTLTSSSSVVPVDTIATVPQLSKAQRVNLKVLFNSRDNKVQLGGEPSEGNKDATQLHDNNSTVVVEPSTAIQPCTILKPKCRADIVTCQSDQIQPSVELSDGVGSTDMHTSDDNDEWEDEVTFVSDDSAPEDHSTVELNGSISPVGTTTADEDEACQDIYSNDYFDDIDAELEEYYLSKFSTYGNKKLGRDVCLSKRQVAAKRKSIKSFNSDAQYLKGCIGKNLLCNLY